MEQHKAEAKEHWTKDQGAMSSIQKRVTRILTAQMAAAAGISTKDFTLSYNAEEETLSVTGGPFTPKQHRKIIAVIDRSGLIRQLTPDTR